MSALPGLAFVLAVLTAATAAGVPIYFGRRKPGYSHLRHTISELGEIGSPVGASVSHVGFVATGVLLWCFLLVCVRVLPDGSAKDVILPLALVGGGYVGGGIFRCDPGAPLFGSWRTNLHNLFGALQYIGAAGAFSMFSLSRFWYPLSELMTYAGTVVLLCLCAVSFSHPLRGLVQRIAEAAIFSGVMLMGWWVYRGCV